jgi:hypothetical protein
MLFIVHAHFTYSPSGEFIKTREYPDVTKFDLTHYHYRV